MAKVGLIYNLKKKKDPALPQDYFSEFDSQETVNAIASAIKNGGHDVYPVEATIHLLDWLRCNRIDIAFNVAEGTSGASRESQIPAILDFLGIPYTGSGTLACALSLDKTMAKKIFIQKGLPTPNFQLFQKKDEELNPNLLFPLIVKPNCEGSAKGIHASSMVTTSAQLYKEVGRIQQLYQQDVLVEEFIDGKEITVGILGNKDIRVLPLLEIDFKNCKKQGEYFYSWEVKEYQGIDPGYPDPEFFCP
ncbi:MAG: D-alanine--D-alanine ligase, partial [Candidatus Omnitrophota bacterium]